MSSLVSLPADLPRPAVGVLVEPRFAEDAQPAGLIEALWALEVPVRVEVVDGTARDLRTWASGLDVIVPRGHGAAMLDTLRGLDSCGARVVNPIATLGVLADRTAVTAALAAADVPTRLATSEGDPAVRVYVAGRHVWAGRVTRHGGADLDVPRRAPLTPLLRRAAYAVARATGLTLLAVDCAVGHERPLVVGVEAFPDYTGVGHNVDLDLARAVLTGTSLKVPVVRLPRLTAVGA